MSNSLCIRCGKERILSKTWKEQIGTSVITYTTSVCPDPECQKKVEMSLKDKKDQHDAIQANSLKRREENRGNRKSKKSSKSSKK